MPLLKSNPERSRKLIRRKLSEFTKWYFGIIRIPLDEKMEHAISQCYDVLSSILLKDVSGSKLCNASDSNSFLHTTSMVFCGAKADANVDAELRPNCTQSTLLVNPLYIS